MAGETGEVKETKAAEAAEAASSAPAVKAAPSVCAGAKIELLGVDLAAVFEKTPKNMKVLVMPTDTSRGGLTLKEIVEKIVAQINTYAPSAGIKAETVNNGINTVLNAVISGRTEDLIIQLNQIYFYLDRETGDDGKTVTKDLEYAFSISLKVDEDAVADEVKSLFAIKEMYFAIWSTESKKIKEAMQLIGIEDLKSA